MKSIALSPRPVTPALLDELESLGLIIRIAPRRHEIPLASGDAIGRPVYPSTDPARGGHLLLACTINQTGFARFGWHEVPEEFLLIGPDDAAPLYLAIFRGHHDAMDSRIRDGALAAEDFTCFRCAFNDAQTSFFTMNAAVPHGECVARTGPHPPSFYVSEPAGTSLRRPDWRGYSLSLRA